MAIDPVALKNEILTGPLSTELATHVGPNPTKPISTSEIARILNRVDAAFQAANFVSAFELEEAIVPSEWPIAGNEQWKRDLLRDILLSIGTEAGGVINADATNLKAKVLLIFPAGATRTALAALQTEATSRALFLFGESVDHERVALAMRS